MDIRCIECRSEFTMEESSGKNACPKCGSTSLPMRISDDVDLKINWHELRIICIWASNFATEKFPDTPAERTLKTVVARLEAQHPEKSALTMDGDVAETARVLGKRIEMHVGDRVKVFDPPEKN